MDAPTTYYIRDGVRRAKAALVCSRETIEAQIDGVGPIINVPLDSLISPKEQIDTSGVRGLSWGKILRATMNSTALPSIEIERTGYGIPLGDVTVGSGEEDFDAFRQLHGQ